MRNGSEMVIRTIASGLDRISDYTTSSTNHRPRSMTCVCFAKPTSLGVTEPFLTQKTGLGLKLLTIKKVTLENKI
jgi:hypothetical protein